MSVQIKATWEKAGLHAILELTKAGGGIAKAIARACSKAGATALRDMRSEAKKRIRARKRLKAGVVAQALNLIRPKGTANLAAGSWTLAVTGKPVALIAYPHREVAGSAVGRSRRTGRFTASKPTGGGVDVEVNVGKRTLVLHAFVATMSSGHEGIFKRRSKARNPIEELLGSRPVDALLHVGEAQGVADRGGKSFGATWARLLPLELVKVK